MLNPYKSYSSNQIENTSPGDQVAALFDKAAEHIATAAEAIERGDIQTRYSASEKTMAILEGLMSSLNRDTPERAEAADNLALYYRTMIMMVSRMNVFNDGTICKSLQKSFIDMADFWRQAAIILAQPQE